MYGRGTDARPLRGAIVGKENVGGNNLLGRPGGGKPSDARTRLLFSAPPEHQHAPGTSRARARTRGTKHGVLVQTCSPGGANWRAAARWRIRPAAFTRLFCCVRSVL